MLGHRKQAYLYVGSSKASLFICWVIKEAESL